MPTPTEALEDSLANGDPLRASADGRSVEDHSIPDKIEGIKFLAGLGAVDGTGTGSGPKSAWRGLRMGRVVPPGAGPS